MLAEREAVNLPCVALPSGCGKSAVRAMQGRAVLPTACGRTRYVE
jgi:hypothetical protein